MTTTSWRAAVVAVGSISLLTSCSFALSGPPSSHRPPDPPDCDVSRFVPIADTLVAAAAGASGIAVAVAASLDDCAESDDEQACAQGHGIAGFVIALLLIPTAIYTPAAMVGFQRTGRCRDAMAEYERRRAVRAPLIGPRSTNGARVLLVARLGSSRSQLERALLAGAPIDYDWLTPREFDERVASHSLGRYPVIVLVDHDPPTLPPPPINLLAFRARGPDAPFRARQTLASVRIDQVKTDHPALRGVALIGANLETVSALAVDPTKGEVALAAAGPHVVIAATSSQDGRVIACGFDPEKTVWARSVAFGPFVHAAVDWLATDPTRTPPWGGK
jgi:hypothetical protein